MCWTLSEQPLSGAEQVGGPQVSGSPAEGPLWAEVRVLLACHARVRLLLLMCCKCLWWRFAGVFIFRMVERCMHRVIAISWRGWCRYWSGVSPTLEPHAAVPIVPEPTPGLLEIDPAILWNPQTLIGLYVTCNILMWPKIADTCSCVKSLVHAFLMTYPMPPFLQASARSTTSLHCTGICTHILKVQQCADIGSSFVCYPSKRMFAAQGSAGPPCKLQRIPPCRVRRRWCEGGRPGHLWHVSWRTAGQPALPRVTGSVSRPVVPRQHADQLHGTDGMSTPQCNCAACISCSCT